MSFLKNMFGRNSKNENEHSQKIRITIDNIKQFPKFENLLTEGKVKFDSRGRLRYLHGAPVGDLLLMQIGKDGKPIYNESSEEWFDPESDKAKAFTWPPI